jgi:hypothetical protein
MPVNETGKNLVLILVAVVLFLGLAAISGRTSINGGLGKEGALYQAMAVDHNLQAAPAVKKLAPAFPLATAIAYATTHDVVSSFFLVNVLAFVVLAFAACWTLDLAGAPPTVKIATVATLPLLGHPSLTSAFDPGQPYLLGVALLALAVAAAEWSSGLLTGILQAGATLASPVGIVAPLYGMWRHWRARRAPAMLVVYAPAVLVWLAVQFWARGGVAGLADLMRISRVRSDAGFWGEAAFILYAAYFLITSLGGLTLLLWSNPRWIRGVVAGKSELLALVVPVLPFLATGGLDVPQVIAFLLPLWFFLVAAWGRDNLARLPVPLTLAGVLTLVTQHPWTRITDTRYFTDWFPYSVATGRVNVSEVGFDPAWRVRMFITAAGVAVFIARRRARTP